MTISPSPVFRRCTYADEYAGGKDNTDREIAHRNRRNEGHAARLHEIGQHAGTGPIPYNNRIPDGP